MQSLLALSVLGLSLLVPLAAPAQVRVSIHIAPPPLLIYAQPPVPGEGYIWIPGYWSWSDPDRGYYWIPGTWVLAPNDGDLWTPGYWAFEQSRYFWHSGYWGPQVGFYGGINYGYGYSGSGYQGGRWDRGAFLYNRAISNVDAQVIHHVYSAPAVRNRSVNRVSFNGGKSGTAAQPTASERRFQATEHAGPRSEQLEHEAAARGMPTQRASGPRGVPQVAATPRPSQFAAPDVEQVRTAPAAGPGRAPAVQGAAAPVHPPVTEPQRAEPRSGKPQMERQSAPRGMPAPRATGPQEVPQGGATPRPSGFAAPNAEHVRSALAEGPGRAPAVQGAATPARAPMTEPQRTGPRAAAQPRPEAPRAPREEPQRLEQRGSGGHPDSPPQEGPPRKER
jgi:hypothetical protein